MAHMIDMSNGRANVAFLGSRNDVWHRLGQEMAQGMSIDNWAAAAGLGWNAIKVPAIAQLPSGELRKVEDRSFVVRDDTGTPLGYCSGENDNEGYRIVQPRDVLAWFDSYIKHDDRFALDVAGSLKGGAMIWATATFAGDIDVAGDKHKARLLMTTTFDGTGATINQGTMTRAVCNNTVRMAHSDKRAFIKTRHSTRFNASRVSQELADIAASVDTYKAMGEAMARTQLTNGDVGQFFKACLDIPFDAKEGDVSTRKLNIFHDLRRAYAQTIEEGTAKGTAWTAFNAVTRYVDHDRGTRAAGSSEDVARFLSANFGSGDALKGKAIELLSAYAGREQSVPITSGLAAAAFGNA